jgi:hypothetical protein
MTIKTLVQGFGKNIRQLKAPQYKESQVRLHYIDPFWTLLGWDVSNDAQLPPQDVEVMVEPSMDSVEDDGLRSREPDYLFRVNGFPRFIVEAKKPAVDIDTDKKAIFQAKRYAWSAAIPFAVLTDFEQQLLAYRKARTVAFRRGVPPPEGMTLLREGAGVCLKCEGETIGLQLA